MLQIKLVYINIFNYNFLNPPYLIETAPVSYWLLFTGDKQDIQNTFMDDIHNWRHLTDTDEIYKSHLVSGLAALAVTTNCHSLCRTVKLECHPILRLFFLP